MNGLMHDAKAGQFSITEPARVRVGFIRATLLYEAPRSTDSQALVGPTYPRG
jgi:hypothetical protein